MITIDYDLLSSPSDKMLNILLNMRHVKHQSDCCSEQVATSLSSAKKTTLMTGANYLYFFPSHEKHINM
jgi:hypothetical protein